LETGSGFLESNNYGTGIVRVNPFVGIWIDGIGFARLGVSTYSFKERGEDESNELKRFDFSTQIGVSALGIEYPYIALSYVRAGAYAPTGDLTWNEIGAGIGHRFMLSPYAAIVVEAEHRWILEHYNKEDKKVSGRRLQMNFGLVAKPF